MKNTFISLAFVALAATLVFASAACDTEVGYPCEITTGGADSGVGVQVQSQAVDCRSRLCIYVVGDSNSKPLCTAICETDDDCPKYDEGRAHLCPDDFVCVVGMTSGALKCCKMCVCKAYLPNLESYRDRMDETCAGFTPNCPEL